MRSLSFQAMNTSVLLATEEHEGSEAGLARARALIEGYEKRFSRFLPDSELSQLNDAAGEWVQVSDELFDLLALSKAYHQETGGLFDPSILPDLKYAGYDASMEEVRNRENTPKPSGPRPAKRDFSGVELDPATNRVSLPEGMQVDLGGLAKGWIVQKAALLLKAQAGAGAVNAGGDIFFAGSPASGAKWRVEIEDPRDEQQTAAVLHVQEGAVVTSSITKRTWRQKDEARHHIIDPRTGRPARTDWLSVTVIAPHADLAEAYAKALLIGGQREATRLMLQRPRIAVVCVGFDGQVSTSPNTKGYLNGSNQLLQ